MIRTSALTAGFGLCIVDSLVAVTLLLIARNFATFVKCDNDPLFHIFKKHAYVGMKLTEMYFKFAKYNVVWV